jgi:hypothetical protein
MISSVHHTGRVCMATPAVESSAVEIVYKPELEAPAVLLDGALLVRPCATPEATEERVRSALRALAERDDATFLGVGLH